MKYEYRKRGKQAEKDRGRHCSHATSKTQPRLLESGKEKKQLHLEVDHRDGKPVNTFIFLFKHFVSTQD